MIKLKVNSNSGIVISELENPNPVVISEENNGITDDLVVSQKMPDNFFGFNTTIEIDEKKLDTALCTRLISLESFGSVLRAGAKYPSTKYEVLTPYFLPEQNAENIDSIQKFWFSKLEKNLEK